MGVSTVSSCTDSNALLVDLQAAESSHFLTLVHSVAVCSMACKRYMVNEVVAESHTNLTQRAANRSHKINHDAAVTFSPSHKSPNS